MAYRVRPQDIDIPHDDPFRHDLLGRKEPAEVLTQILRSIEGPCTLSIDAAWGNGKTTFLQIWAQHLRNLSFPVVEFNAWDTDFSGDPFLALSDAVTTGIGERSRPRESQLKDAAKKILCRSIPSLIRLGTAGLIDPEHLIGKEVTGLLSSLTEEHMKAYAEQRKSITSFRSTLEQSAEEISQDGQPLVIMIDELDRCRPTYAIELLETAKHLFSVPKVIFILAVNRSELKHSVSTMYGNSFDGDGYLRRFFDIDFMLPKPSRIQFIDQMIHSTRIHEYFSRTMDREARQYGFGVSEDVLKIILDNGDISLREIAKTIHHLGVVFSSLRSDRKSFILSAIVGILLKTMWPELYMKFCNGEINDAELVEEVFSIPQLQQIREGNEGTLFEMAIMAAFMEMNPGKSSLLEYHESMAAKEEEYRSERIANTVKLLMRDYGFKYAIDRIELLSPDLVTERADE